MKSNNYLIIGVMSGTSLDGLDIAFCEFTKINQTWKFQIIDAHTFKYSEKWKRRLSKAHRLNAYDFVKLDREYGIFIGERINKFLINTEFKAQYISSHGHTVFHSPKDLITFQIGSGSSIAAKTGISTICDFRSLDVAFHGQGAPLVPIGDEMLFKEYSYCLNLGGFANISENINGKRLAMDICPANIVINYLANKKKLEFDKNGSLAENGHIIKHLLNSLNQLDYYKTKPPKSLSKEWLEYNFLPIINKSQNSVEDVLRTIYEHIIEQICKVTKKQNTGNILITGGGANNRFLIELLRKRNNLNIIIPNQKIIDFKEALIFAFLGILRIRKETNCLSTVTGAKKDNIGGGVHLP